MRCQRAGDRDAHGAVPAPAPPEADQGACAARACRGERGGGRGGRGREVAVAAPQPPHLALAAGLAGGVATLVLDEVDALVPGKKDFRGKRHRKWLGARCRRPPSLAPAPALARARRARARGGAAQIAACTLPRGCFARRSTRPDLQAAQPRNPPPPAPSAADLLPAPGACAVLAARATLDRSTRLKLSRQPRRRRRPGQGLALCPSAAPPTRPARRERLTSVPACIEHRTLRLGCRRRRPPAAREGAVGGEGGGGRAAGGGLPRPPRARAPGRRARGGARAVSSARGGLLSDALWPSSTRAQAAAARGAAGGQAAGQARRRRGRRRGRARRSMPSCGGAARLVVATRRRRAGSTWTACRASTSSASRQRRHLLHLAGRTGRWPGPSTRAAATRAS